MPFEIFSIERERLLEVRVEGHIKKVDKKFQATRNDWPEISQPAQYLQPQLCLSNGRLLQNITKNSEALTHAIRQWILLPLDNSFFNMSNSDPILTSPYLPPTHPFDGEIPEQNYLRFVEEVGSIDAG